MGKGDFLFAIFGALAIGFGLGSGFMAKVYQSAAIDHGYAEHDPKTGQWKWIEKQPTKEHRDE